MVRKNVIVKLILIICPWTILLIACQICSQSGECQGNSVGDEFVPTEEDCQRECFYNVNCQWYTYDHDFQYCLLTTDCIVMNNTLKVYGEKSCYDDNGGYVNPSNVYWLRISKWKQMYRLSYILIGSWTKLMVVGGFGTRGDSEIIDLSGQNLNCPTIADYPIKLGQTGTFINNKAMVCGGYQFEYHDECYSYDLQVNIGFN